MTYSLVVTDTFLNQLLGLPHSVTKSTPSKMKRLQENPQSVDGDSKKIKGRDNLYRVRINNYRLLYSFGSNWVKCLAIGHRSKIYKNLNLEVPEDELQDINTDDEFITSATETPGLISQELLNNCRIPEEYHQQLLQVTTDDELLSLDIPEKLILRILDNLYPPKIENLERQPERLIEKIEDIEDFFAGNITEFLLKLDEEQERICNYKIKEAVLMKGGPGTGKTVLAIYRVKKFIELGHERILFTAHSSALINYARKLLAQLLGDEINKVTIETVDSEITSYYLSRYSQQPILSQQQSLEDIQQALIYVRDNHNFTGVQRFNWLAAADRLEKKGYDYLYREIIEVIEGCGLINEKDYLEFNSATIVKQIDKQFMWQVYQHFKQLLSKEGLTTEEEFRIKALELAQKDNNIKEYDAIIIDETQDLSPVSLRFILKRVSNKKNVFITADSSQSIYRRGFNWRQVHQILKGHILDLNYNYRNTGEIVTAYCSILYPEDNYQPSLRKGEIPTVYFCRNNEEEAQKIKTFFINSAKIYRMPLTGAALICPSIKIAHQYVDRLNKIELPVRYVDGSEIDLNSPYIKVITMEASKGLEFAFVAVAGLKKDVFPYTNPQLSREEAKINLAQQKRLFYVACSRAIQNLGVYTSNETPSKLAQDLREPYWVRDGAYHI